MSENREGYTFGEAYNFRKKVKDSERHQIL